MIFDYRSFFELEDGEELKKVVLATYSFDISLLPMIWLYAGRSGKALKYVDQFGDRQFCNNIFADFISENSPLVTVFFQENLLTNSSLKDNGLVRIALDYSGLYPIKTDGKICFHPKMICLEIWKNNKPDYYKLAVLSRNLTKSESPEAAVVLRRDIGKDEYIWSNVKLDQSNDSKELFGEFANCMQGKQWHLCVKPSETDRWQEITLSVEAEVFVQQHSETDSSICAEMLNEKRGQIQNALIISPGFNDNPVLKLVNDLDKGKKRFVSSLKNDQNDKSVMTHEKIYFFQRKKSKYEIWIGSSNCSARGLGESNGTMGFNWECMVCLSVNEEIYKEQIKSIKDRYIIMDQLSDDLEADDIEVENDKEYFDLCGEIMKFINGTKVTISGEKCENGYKLAVIVNRESNFPEDEFIKYKDKVSVCFAVSNLLAKNDFQKDDKEKMIFEYEKLSFKSVSEYVMICEMTAKGRIGSRIVKAEFEDKYLKEELEKKWNIEKEDIRKKMNERQLFPRKQHKETEVIGSTENGMKYRPVFSPEDGDYEKLMKLYMSDDTEFSALKRYKSFWETMYSDDELAKELVESANKIMNGEKKHVS